MSGYTTATMAVVALVSTAVSTYASYQNAQQQQKAQKHQQDVARAQAEYQGEIAQKNQELAEEQARAQRREGYQNMVKKRQETAKLIGQQRAKQGASGATVGFGSSLDLNLDTAEQGEFDALAEYQKGLNSAYNTEIQAWGYGQQAEGYQMQADAAANAPTGGSPILAATATGLSGLSSTLSSTKDMWGVGKTAPTLNEIGKANFNSAIAPMYGAKAK